MISLGRGRATRFITGVAVLSFTAASCGLAPRSAGDLGTAVGSGVSVGGTGSGGSVSGSSAVGGASSASGLPGGSTTGVVGATGQGTSSGATGTATGGTAGGSAATGTSGATAGTAGSSGNGAGTGGTSSSAAYERIGERNGVIYIGIHAPETGAAPIPLQAFATGAKLFWENHTVFGHQVVMQFMDDQYNPSVARQVCESMSRQDLFVIGGAGTDQIQACATDPVLTSSHTPYFSAGVTTNGLGNLPYYFAISQTYAAQSPEVFTMASSLYGSDAHSKWAVVTENTPNFSDAQQSIDKVLSGEHVSFCNVPTPKYFSESDAQSAVNAAHSCGARVVYLDVDPNFWIDMVREATASAFFPDWVGPGITNGENLVASPVCAEQANLKAAYLSPYPGLDHQPAGFSSESNPPPDAPASERDIELLIYGVSEVVYNAMLSVGSYSNLTRDNLIAAMSKFQSAYGKQLTVFPSVNFAGGHLGGTGAWELKLNCSQQEYDTAGMLSS